ncbi:glycosyl hydrolase-related protein, partial [Nonomuraea lactucae]|uniref:glycosyl hydrolase-related protein n=1 Tax=Nonomuraea lactucae TaxID=2249762 RepID=UPI001F06DBEC
VAAGYALNLPLRVVPGGTGAAPAPLVGLDGSAARIEAVKLADDGSGDVIVRVYESLGGRADTRLRASFPVTSARVDDLLERSLDQRLRLDGDGAVPITLRPFQVLTVRLARR